MSIQAVKIHSTDEDLGQEVLRWLADSQVFKGLGPDALQAFVDGSVLRSFEPLQEAVSEGDRHAALNIVVSGRLIALLASEQLSGLADDAMVSLDSYLAGDSFGEACLVEKTPSPATASIVATEASQVLSISRDNFKQIIGADDRVGQVVYRNLFRIQTSRLRAVSTLRG